MSLDVYLEKLPAAFAAAQEFVVQNIEWSGRRVAKLVQNSGLTRTSAWRAIAPKVSNCWAQVSPHLRTGYVVSVGLGLLACLLMNRTLKRTNLQFEKYPDIGTYVDVQQNTFLERVSAITIIGGLFIASGVALTHGRTQVL